MKKVLMFMATVAVAVGVNAATVGWNVITGSTDYAGKAYQLFVIGQNGVTDISTVTDLIDQSSDTSTYAFASGNLANNGAVSVMPANSGKNLDVGTYTSFMVLFDTEDASKAQQYVVLSGTANQTKTIGDKTPSVSFAAGNVNAIVTNPENWTSVPEPTSGILLLVGGALLALRRKQK